MVLLKVARSELSRRRHQLRIAGPELDDLAYQTAADALVKITAKIGDFRGESRFTTWAYRFVVFEVAAKIGRHFWATPMVALDEDGWSRLPDRLGVAPSDEWEGQELMMALRRCVEEALTPHQRRIFTAVVLQEIPLDALVIQWDTNRNAIYKTLFDARRKLRAALVASGHLEPSKVRAS